MEATEFEARRWIFTVEVECVQPEGLSKVEHVAQVALEAVGNFKAVDVRRVRPIIGHR